MKSRMWVISGVLALAVCVFSAKAQESLLPLPLEKISVAEALAKSKREHRILVVVREWKRPPFGRRPWWVNDSVRAWIAWHAVLVEVQPEDPEGKLYLEGVPRDKSNGFWGVDVFVDGIRTRLLKIDPALCPCEDLGTRRAAGPDDHGDTEMLVGITGAAMLGQFDLQLLAGHERSPLWSTLHKRDCPEPLRPERLYWYGLEKDGLPRTSDVSRPEKGDRYVDVFARIKEADRLAAAGKSGEAFALLAWAWERGPEVDPGFSFARVGVVLPRMIDLRRARPAATKRMEQIAESELALYPWFDDHEELGYLCLRRAGGDKGLVDERLVVEILDGDEVAFGGVVAERVGEMKAAITELSLTTPITADRWRALLKMARQPLPRPTDDGPKKRWNKARIELLTIGATRQYALLLASDDPAERVRAGQVADDVLKEAASSEPALRAAVLRALTFAAVSVGRSGPVQAAWLDEAAKINPAVVGGEGDSLDPLKRFVGASK